MHIKEIGS